MHLKLKREERCHFRDSKTTALIEWLHIFVQAIPLVIYLTSTEIDNTILKIAKSEDMVGGSIVTSEFSG